MSPATASAASTNSTSGTALPGEARQSVHRGTRPVVIRYQAGVRYLEYIHDEWTPATAPQEPVPVGGK